MIWMEKGILKMESQRSYYCHIRPDKDLLISSGFVGGDTTEAQVSMVHINPTAMHTFWNNTKNVAHLTHKSIWF